MDKEAYLWSLCVNILFFTVWSDVGLTQNDVTNGWTFSSGGYLAFYPNLTVNENQRYGLNFRTKEPHGLLFCHIITHQKTDSSSSGNYRFFAELYRGYLQVTYALNGYTDVLKLGKALNDDSWHSIEVFLDTQKGIVEAALDSHPKKSENLRAYAWSDPNSILDWTKLQSVVVFGGLGNSKPSFSIDQFIGCMRDLKHLQSGVFWEIKSFSNASDVTQGCNDQCVQNNLCEGGSRCINKYDSALCDCFGTGKEGDYCQIDVPTEVTLQGFEWLTYELYKRSQDRVPTDQSRYSLQFKSERASGVLLYAVGNVPGSSTGHTHVIASVHNGVVKASVAFNDQVKVEQEMGVSVNDNKTSSGGWHNLTIIHNKSVVDFYLDSIHYRKTSGTSNHYLSLDPIVYIGGGDNLVKTVGLQVTRNFVGCLKNVYINEESVLYQLKTNGTSTSHYPRGHHIQYGCRDVQNISMTFPKSGTTLLLNGYIGGFLTVNFDLRTVREEAVIFYTQLKTLTSEGYPDYLHFEVWIHNRMPLMKFIPLFSDNIKTLLVPMEVSDNKWHSLSIQISQRQVKVAANNVAKSEMFESNVEVESHIVIGYGSRDYGEHEGYVGCIRNLVLNGIAFDPIEKLNTPPSPGDIISGVLLDSCHLIDYCQDGSPCQHSGKCLSDWMGVSCDCSATHYVGKTCQFPKYRSSCDSYYQAGARTSGVYIVDVDGAGPSYVKCIMGYSHGDDLYGQTVVEHNLGDDMQIRGENMADMRILIKYREMSLNHLLRLTTLSTWCEQYVQYSCSNAPLRLGDLTMFKAASGELVNYLGHARSRSCPCSLDNSCRGGQSCSCDAGAKDWEIDDGYNQVNKQLPITEVTVLQGKVGDFDSSNGTLSLGPLRCWGNKNSLPSTAVTFKTGDSYLQLQGMNPAESGVLIFSFRTYQDRAVLLYQAGGTNNTNNFKITLESGQLLRFRFYMNKKVIQSDFTTENPVNDGEWHQIMVEINNLQIRGSLDLQQYILSVPGVHDQDLAFAGDLFLGGLSYEENPEGVPGLVGCMKGIHYNGKMHDLSEEVDESMSEIVQGCTPYCKMTQPCMNGAKCIEKWDGYECICTNKWAHSGHSCENNINENVVTFTGSKSSYLETDVGTDPRLIDSEVLLSFRTTEHRGLLFYMYDELNNFIQLEIRPGYKLVLSFNQFRTIRSIEVTIPEIADGEWKQVVIQTFDNGNLTKIIVDDLLNQSRVFPFRRFKLTSYDQNPFPSQERVKPKREARPESPFVRLLVGGAPVNTSSISNFKGCIRGLKVRNKVVDLQGHSKKYKKDVTPACESGCNPSPCKNSGICSERWGDRNFTCICDDSDFTGKTCDMEASGVFDGTNAVEYRYIPYGTAARTTSEELSFVFKSNCTEQKWMMLVLWCASKEPNHGYIVVTLHPEHGIIVQWGEASINRNFRKSGQFCDGKPHRFSYRRNLEVIFVGIDRTNYEEATTTDSPMKGLDTVILGGIVHNHDLQNVEILKRLHLQNFTGCLSEVIFTPTNEEPMKFQPMKELRELKNGSVEWYGSEPVQCSPLRYDTTTVRMTTTTVTITENPDTGLTLPPWNPGAAVTHYLNGTPPPKKTTPLTTTTASTRSTTSVTITTSTPPVNTSDNLTAVSLQGSSPLDDLTMIIAICLIAFCMLISFIIAIILHCLKRRQVYNIKHNHYHVDYELKQPLNPSTVPRPPPRPHSTHMPLATFDEFSMVSATLGPSVRRTENGFAPGKVHTLPADIRNTDYPVQTSFLPMTDPDIDGPVPNVYSKKKNRPASSISEVLEEMERQRKAKELGVDPDTYEESPKSGRSSINHGEGELEWDPQTDRTPLTVGLQRDTIYENPDEDDDVESSDDRISCSTDSDPLKVLEEQNDLTQDYNGDSGYEAESQRNGEEDNLLHDADTTDIITPQTPDDSKMYYDISCLTYAPHDSPNFASTPRKVVVDHDGS